MESRNPAVAVFGSSRPAPGEAEYEAARQCGILLASAGYTVVTGGYFGTMEAVSRGAAEAGGLSIGVTAPGVFPQRTGANRFVTEEIITDTLTERIHTMVAITEASIALPGSIGTLTELVVAWNVAHVAGFSDKAAQPIVAVGSRWSRLVPHVAAAVVTDPSFVTCVETVPEAVAIVSARLSVPDSP